MKFAYMIMAHQEPYILERLIKMLDYPENDIFLHIDAKSSINEIILRTDHANLHRIDSINVSWGGQSQISAELRLLTEASKTQHDYYHLISGVDLPLKSHREMLEFFEKHKGFEFIGVTPGWTEDPLIQQRYQLHWLFQNQIGRKKNLLCIVSRIVTKIEKLLGYTRGGNETTAFYGGPNWFSLTEKAVKCILQEEDWVKRRFRNTICCDEIFAQTILINHHFSRDIYNCQSDNSYAQCLRFTDFEGTSPRILEINDLNRLLDSKCLFARKFGTEKDEQKRLVDVIYNKFK